MQALSGTMWKLVRASAFDMASAEEVPSPFGPTPIGFVVFMENRMLGGVADGASSRLCEPRTGAFAAYSGEYSFDGTHLVTEADCASAPALLGRQTRQVIFESPDRIVIRPVNAVMGREGGSQELIWERVS